jgi:2-polyprenyl-3-methyl-5-hydroxy-6-metoxy-1,4-benzoquinol methylase
MTCIQCQGIEELFDEKTVQSELARYRTKGASKTTCLLVTELEGCGVRGATLLDIGGGVGAVHHELLNVGVQSVTDVDASQAYLRAAQAEAERLGIADRVQFAHGNFVELADDIQPADIVTLDRVLCCYPDLEQMVNLSARRARQLYGLVYPRDAWWIRLGAVELNFVMRLRKSSFRFFPHPTGEIEAILQKNGLHRTYHNQTLFWQVAVYTRQP